MNFFIPLVVLGDILEENINGGGDYFEYCQTWWERDILGPKNFQRLNDKYVLTKGLIAK